MPYSEKDTRQDFNEAYRIGFQYWSPFWCEAKRDLEFSLGKQWSHQQVAYLRMQGRDPLVFNKMKRVINMISGYQRKHRLAMTVEPIENADEQTSNQLSACLMWIMQYLNGYNVMSDCFEQGALKTGINLLAIYLDYSEDPVNGDIRFRRLPYNSFLLDPNFTERDLSDCSWLTTRQYLNKDIVKILLPGQAGEIEKIRPRGLDMKYAYLPMRKDMYGKDLLSYDGFWVKKAEQATMIIDKQTGEMRVWKSDKKRLDLFLGDSYQIHGDRLATAPTWRSTAEFNILVNDEPLYHGPDPWGLDDFPYVPIIGYWDPEYDDAKWKLQGVSRCMRDPQTEGNKRRLKVLDMIDSQIASGWKAKEGAPVNPESLYRSGQGEVVWIKDDAQMTDVEKVTPPDIPAGMFQLMDVLDKDLMEIPGANSELFGMPEGENLEVAAILAKQREGAGLTILQPLIDNYRTSKKIAGQKLIKMIQKNWSPLKVQRIINQTPSPEFYKHSFGKYDCIPAEGLLSDTQRQLYFSQLLYLKSQGAPIPWTALFDAAPIQGKKRLQEMITQAEESQKVQMQVDLKDKQLVQQMMQAKMLSDMAAAEQKRSSARASEGKAVLDRVKATQEIAQLKDERFFKLYDFVERVSTPQERRQVRNQAMVRR